MVWGAICADGSQVIAWVDGAINSEKYCEILAENIFDRFDMDEMIFQKDNAPSHNSRYT